MIEDILAIKTLIETYDRELSRQGFFHRLFPCYKCKSLITQRKYFIMKLKRMLENR